MRLLNPLRNIFFKRECLLTQGNFKLGMMNSNRIKEWRKVKQNVWGGWLVMLSGL